LTLPEHGNEPIHVMAGLSQPSTSLERVTRQDVDARDKPGHDEEASVGRISTLHGVVFEIFVLEPSAASYVKIHESRPSR